MLLPAEVQEAVAADGLGLRILVVRLGALGDIVRTLPAVRALRFSLPEAEVSWVCDDRWERILRGHPDLDRVLLLPRRGGIASLISVPRFLGELRSLGANLVLDFHGNLRSGLVGRLSAARFRLGYDGHQQKEGNRRFTTHRIEPGPRRRSRLERNLDLVRALGVAVSPLPDAGLPISRIALKAAREAAAAAGTEPGRYALINPGASARQAYKKPPAEALAAAARGIAAAGLVPLVVWGPGEERDAGRVVESSGGVARLAPPTTLEVLVALIRRARLLVGGDSGPLHLACGVGCPVVALYGPTDPAVNAPWGVPSRIVVPRGRAYTGIKRIDRRAGGFEGIDPAEVERAVSETLAAARGRIVL